MGSSDFPSMNARQFRRLLARLGYEGTGQGSGSHEILKAPGRPTLLWAFHSNKEVSGGLVKKILVKDVGLCLDEAREVLRGKARKYGRH